jgi:hypothetical protein
VILRRAAAALVLLAAASVYAQESETPQPPCAAHAPVPAYAKAAEAPAMQTWTEVQWQPSTCIGWPGERYRFVIAMAGSVEGEDDVALRRRIGAISTSRGLRYWSVSENAPRVLIKDAAALSGPNGARREDFNAGDIRAGAVLHFVEEDNRSSKPVRYRMRVLEATRDRIVVETENLTPVESLLVTLFPPGALRAAYIMSRLEKNAWGFYAISASTSAANPMVKLAKESYINRARALYGHFAGVAAVSE